MDNEPRDSLIGYTTLALIGTLSIFGIVCTAACMIYGVRAAAHELGPLAVASWFAAGAGVALTSSLAIGVIVWAADKAIVKRNGLSRPNDVG